MVTRSRVRFLGIALTLLALALGLWAALWLIGWPIPLLSTSLPDAHGVLMVNGVLASLIGIERAVALEQRVFYLAPLLTAVGAISLALSGDVALAFPIITSGAVALLLIFLVILRRQPALHTVVQVLGAACLVGGNVLGWSGLDIPFLIPWWGTFLVLLLGAERLELSRVLRLNMLDKLTFAISVALALLGCVLSALFFASGFLVVASGWILVAVWLLFHDIAYQNLSRPGLPRFMAFCLLSGYAWLLLGGGIVYSGGGILLGFSYDAGLHAVFLGFVLSLVFAHALIILPAVLGKRLPFHRVLYVPVALLYISLAVRIYADFGVLPVLREWAGLFNVVAIVLFGALLPALYLYERTPFRQAYGADASTFYP